MFGLFKKKITVQEIEDALYAAYTAFDNINKPEQLEQVIISFKQKHPRTCPKSLLLQPSTLHVDELYVFIWCYIFAHMESSGLRVNPNLFKPHSPLWEVLDAYIQKARKEFKMKIWLSGFWQTKEAEHVQEELSKGYRDYIEKLIAKSLKEEIVIETNIDWHDAEEFYRGGSYTADPGNESVRFLVPIDPEDWDSNEIWVFFTRTSTNTTRISARPA
jgi:hypothetical protein